MHIDQSLRTKIDEAFKNAFKDIGKYDNILDKAINGTATTKELRDIGKYGQEVERSLKAISRIYGSFDENALKKAFDFKNIEP
jgi:hypothetical protein